MIMLNSHMAKIANHLSLLLLLFTLVACAENTDGGETFLSEQDQPAAYPSGNQPLKSAAEIQDVDQLIALLKTARRIPNSSKWFEIISLPNDVYALWEPGHVEKVNSYLIIGADKDVLYDTGMGIASIGQAINELRAVLGRGNHPLMVINSHNHLDHNGGNNDFDEAWIIRDEWAIQKLTGGISGGFTTYWAELTPHEGIEVPQNFDPETFSIPPFPLQRVRYLADGDVVDLGDRQFQVIHTTSHSPDGLALYDETNQVFFGGDTFGGGFYMTRDMSLLAADLERISALQIRWHYASHGAQLIEAMQEGQRLAIVRRILGGDSKEGMIPFAGQEFPIYTLDNVQVVLATDFLIY
ncbi:MAG: MBL fold metallo-hydrolase [Gammaproteobacteria bacterium]|nr:MBL fold metallo-hydrolase [Gammaproteobacteria bacterium]